MLTSDLVQTQIQDGAVEPEYVDPDGERTLEQAAQLVEIFESHADAPQGEIDEKVDQITGYGTDYKVWRGLAKLLYDRSEFETVAPADPVEIRRRVFEVAEATDGTKDADWRAEVLAEAAEAFEATADRLSETLYADLDERQRLVDFESIEPVELVHRYNLALAQAVLYKATHLEVELRDLDPNMLRYLFQVLKFNRLMHRCAEIEEGYRLTIDGPASLFKRNRKYGMRLARFLPALVLADDWQMRAELDWEEEERRMTLSSEEGLVSHYTAQGQWKADEEQYFEEQFDDWETDWELRREGAILQLGENQVLVPDYVMEHPDGRVAHVEIVGFWRLSYLRRRIELLEQADEIPLVLVVSEKLKTGREELESSPASVFFFKTVILVDKVIEAAEAVAL
jgi:hypothetical protein